MPQAPTTLSPNQEEVWKLATSQIEAMRVKERGFAQQVRRDLLLYPGYFAAARQRVEELVLSQSERPHWCWAWERWADLLSQGGLHAVIQLLDDPDANQELLSASPFAVMRPPMKENDYYRSHAAT
jgi:hypothetical protein